MLNFFFLLLVSCLPALAIIEAPVNPIDFEQNPNSIAWKKIETKHFEVIFPEEMESEAQRATHLIEMAYPFVTRSLEVNPPKISLILQNQSTDSNGFVTLAPRRSEWYVTPSIEPQITNTEWLKTLSIHEFRHVVQFQKTRQNFNRYYEILLGQAGQALGLAFTLPPWYLEGDAVGMETALTKGGRGRLPIFERDLRTLLLSDKKFDFDKSILRSYEDWVPNHYVYGYFLTTAMRTKYGDLFLSHIADQSTKTSWNPLSLYNSGDRMFEGNFEQFYADTMREMLEAWKEQLAKLTLTPYAVKTADKRWGWTNYNFPMVTSKGKVVALKSGLSFIGRFVLVDGKKEEDLFYPGSLIQDYPFKLRKDKFAYTELELDPRWGYRNFTRVKVYDVEKRKIILDVPHTKLRLAALNAEANKILAIEWNENQNQSAVVLNLNGKELKRVALPKGEVVTSIDWKNDHEAVVVIKDFYENKSLASLDLEAGTYTNLINKTEANLGFVNVSEGEVLLESPASGIDNIYRYQDGSLTQITTAPFGAYAPSLHQGKLFYNNYTVNGMDIVEKSAPWDKEEASSGSFVPFYEKIAKFEDRDSLAAKLAETQKFKVTDYSQVGNAINLHSWTILAPPLGATIMLVGYSRDVLNKFSLSAGGEYNLNEHTTQGFVSAAWSNYYPVFDLRAAYGTRNQEIRGIDNRWEEGTFETGIQVPWKRITGRFNQSFTTRAFAKVIHVANKITNDLTEVNDGSLFSPGVEANYSILQRTATRDFFAPWGLVLIGHLEEGKDISGVNMTGSILSLDSRLYLPGLWKHHAFYHQFAYERQRDDFYQYASYILYPRGTKSVFLEEFTKYSANYTLPLFYPDWSLSRYLYLKRIAMNVFYDELHGHDRGFSYVAASTGWELLLETNFLRLMLPLTWGLRGSYLINGVEKDSNYELFIASTLGTF